METTSIWTYHCICSHLILATTRDIFKLPRRQAPGLDGAIIVPLPPPPRSADSDNESDEDEDEDEENLDSERMEIDRRDQARPSATADSRDAAQAEHQQLGNETTDDNDDLEPKDYTLLLSSLRDKKPCIIRREDGFEKRLLWRCGRCRLIFGYQIYDETLEELNEEDSDKKRAKRRLPGKKYYVYILPGGLTTAAGMGSLKEADLQLLSD